MPWWSAAGEHHHRRRAKTDATDVVPSDEVRPTEVVTGDGTDRTEKSRGIKPAPDRLQEKPEGWDQVVEQTERVRW
jgi:hypothetical protein